MSIGQILRRWGLAVVLAFAALVFWQLAEANDTDEPSLERVAYERVPETPMLSGRRVPRTLQTPVVDDRLTPVIRAMVDDSPAESCVLVEVDGRQMTPASRPDTGHVPASNQKILTTYGAYLLLGADFVYTTRVVADVVPVAGVVDGNLYLIGSGDPFLTTDNWWEQFGDDAPARPHTRLEDLADAVEAAGITEVTGSLIGDESLFDAERQGRWADRLIQQKQSGPLSALTVNEGFVDWPADFAAVRLRSETDNPPLHAASVLNQLLADRGVTVAGIDAGEAPADAVDVAEVESPPLLDVLTHINSWSSNIGAELLLKRIGVEGLNDGSAAAGARVLRDTLDGIGVPVGNLIIDDGSGLAETNRLTCAAIAAILAHAGPDSEFVQTMAIAGERGSLLGRMATPPLEGNVFAKTGTLQDASALSGYVQSATDADTDILFAYMANEAFISGTDITDLQDSFAASLSRYPGAPTMEDLSPLPPQ